MDKDQFKDLITTFDEINGEDITSSQSKDEEEVSILDLPPRSQTHADKNTGMKWKVSFPLVRLLVVLFLLMIGLVLSYQMWGKDWLDSTSVEQGTSINPAGEVVHIIAEDTKKQEAPINEVNDKEEVGANPETPTDESIDHQESVIDDGNSEISPQDGKGPKEELFLYHTVQKGDTLFSIAMKYYGRKQGETIIMEANNLNDKTVELGSTLSIPIEQEQD